MRLFVAFPDASWRQRLNAIEQSVKQAVEMEISMILNKDGKKRNEADAIRKDTKALRAEVRRNYRETHKRLKTLERVCGIKFKRTE